MQTINRTNYEELFLLYVDNELSASLKHTVENFAKQNPDLAIELDMLLQAKALPEAIMFADKDVLLRTEGESIDESNYEEYFLLYIDNELSSTKRAEVEMYVLQHPKLQDEFTLLKQAVLMPEAITYGNKEELYRTEKRRAVYFKPWQLAAAAVFFGVCLTGWWLMQKPAANVSVAIITPTVNQSVNPAKPSETTAENNQPDNALQQKQQPIIQQQTIAQQTKPAIKKATRNTAIRLAEKGDKEIAPVIDVAENNRNEAQPPAVIQHPLVTRNQVYNPKEPPAQAPDIVSIPDRLVQNKNDITSLDASGKNIHAGDAKVYPVKYKEINTNDDDQSLHVGMFDLNKKKVKTLFKKAGRMFNNKSTDLSNEDGKLQVANFEIDTKN